MHTILNGLAMLDKRRVNINVIQEFVISIH